MVTACAFSMMKISTRTRTTAPAIIRVRASPIRLPRRPGRAGLAGLASDGVGTGPSGAGVGAGTGLGGAAPLGEGGGKVVVGCEAGSVMGLLLSCERGTGSADRQNLGTDC